MCFTKHVIFFLFFFFSITWLTAIFHGNNTRRCCTMAGRNKPEGRLMPWIPTWLSVGARRVICINPSRHSHPDPAALCTWRNGSQRCCPDNWALDYRLWEYGEGEKTKRKGVIVWTRGRLISQICLNFGRLIKNCARPWTVGTHLAVNHFGGGLRRDAGDLNRPIREEVFCF